MVWESVDEGIVVVDSTKRWGYVSGGPVAETKTQTKAQERFGGERESKKVTTIPDY